MRILTGLVAFVLSCFVMGSAFAACDPDKLGTSRTMKVDTSKFRKIRGTEKQFGLRPKEVILTFDDGPIAGKTSRILKTLKKECVKATFFYVGRMAQAYPRLVRRVVRDGHTLAHHTHNHNNLPKYSGKNGGKKIDRGIRALQKIAYGDASSKPRTPFFRYPYLARNKRTDRLLAARGMVAFDANIDALDWKKVSPSRVHNRIMRRLRKEGKGIILMHDIQGRTAKMLPRLLRSLKDEGYKVVHMVPKGFVKPEPEELVVARAGKPTIADDKKPYSVAALNKNDAPDADNQALLADLSSQVVNSSSDNLKAGTLAKEGGALTKSVKTKQHTNRTGVKLNSTAGTSIPKVGEAALKPAKGERSKKKKKRSVKKKRSFVVLAGGKRKRRTQPKVLAGGWKLRRSQWILN